MISPELYAEYKLQRRVDEPWKLYRATPAAVAACIAKNRIAKRVRDKLSPPLWDGWQTVVHIGEHEVHITPHGETDFDPLEGIAKQIGKAPAHGAPRNGDRVVADGYLWELEYSCEQIIKDARARGSSRGVAAWIATCDKDSMGRFIYDVCRGNVSYTYYSVRCDELDFTEFTCSSDDESQLTSEVEAHLKWIASEISKREART